MAAERQVFKNLKAKVAIVTGASAGIGESIAIEFARQGCHLTLCGRDETRLLSVADKCLIEGEGQIKVECVTGDIVSQDTQNAIINKTIEAFGKLDVLVNNAAIGIFRNPLTTNHEDFNILMRTNVEAVFFLTQLAIPHLIKTQGSVVNLSSIVSAKAAPTVTAYAMTKAAIDSFTKSLALCISTDSALLRITVEAPPDATELSSESCERRWKECPGTIVSMILRRGEDAMDDEQYEKATGARAVDDFKRKIQECIDRASAHYVLNRFLFCKKAASLHPLGNRIGKVTEVADAVAFLASESASFTTGQILYVDGGRSVAGAVFSN